MSEGESPLFFHLDLSTLGRWIPERLPIWQMDFLDAPARKELTCVLVDDKYLLLQVNEMLESGQMGMGGILVVDDSLGEVKHPFREFFEEARRNNPGNVRRLIFRRDGGSGLRS